GLCAVVAQIELKEHLCPTHDAQPNAPVGMHFVMHLSQREGVDVNHVVEEARGDARDALQLVPGDLPVPHKEAEVDRAEVARVVGTKPLLAAVRHNNTIRYAS